MRKYVLLTFTFLLFCIMFHTAIAQNCTYQWNAQNSGVANQLTVVKAVSGMICWTGGANATVRRTTDGGSTWVNGNPNPVVIAGMVNCIDAFDGNTAWLSTTNSGSTFIYKTTNGGTNWQQVFSSSQTRIFGLKMTDASNGFAFGDPISNIWQMLVTTNGGINWQLSPNAPAAGNIETCLPNSFQVSLPNIWWGTSVTTVYRSTNSGVSFTSHAANVTGIYILAVHYNSEGVGFSSSTSMSKSTNSGVNYASLPAPGSGNIEAIQGEGQNFWFIRGNGIYRSTDSGSSWELVFTSAQSLVHMDFPDNLSECQTGWAVGNGGNIYKMTGNIVGSMVNQNEIPAAYELKQNFPNPFNPETTIEFYVPKSTNVELRVFDIAGNEVSVLQNGELTAGNYRYKFNTAQLASGIYFYTLKTPEFTQTRKMLLVK